jgi:PAS domain S-box-containing protein
MIGRSHGVAGVFAIMAIVVIVSITLTYWAGLHVIHLRALAISHRQVIAESERLLSTLKDAETGQRGFIITGIEDYLAPYYDARARLPEVLNQLRSAKGITIPAANLNAIQQLTRAKLSELKETIDLRRSRGFDAAAAAVLTDKGTHLMNDLRDQIGELQNKQASALQDEAAAADEATQMRTVAFTFAGIINLLFIVWAYQRITVAIKDREAALAETQSERAEVQRQKDLLAVTLASIGDCVIVTDNMGRITFMNVVAEKVTGWKFEEARLRPTAEVFKIVNEFSHEPVESPVEKVMKHGAIIGLANHTLLIRKDGSEVPIDDSGAPIREADGTMRGTVLVFRDFSEHKEAERKLKEAKEKAETANKAKDQFLAMLSHELRTPLTPVLATLNLWEASDELPPSMHVDAQMLRRSIELEARIIDDLLDLTRIAKGMLSFSPEDTDVHDLLQFLVGMCRSELQGKELALSLHLNAVRNYVHTDAGRLQQVLWNIMRNATKFTESGGTVSITTSNDQSGNISVMVADTGIGMTPETLSKLFTPFEQGEQFISRRYGGLGLGMAISSALAGLLGGSLTAKSDGLGEGSTFTVTFPSMETAPIVRKPVNVDGKKRSGNGLKILLVEDHDDTAVALGRLLRKQGYEIETADSVASALEAVHQGTFHLLLCDIGLPDGTGFQLMEEVRKGCRTPALALSGFGMEEDVARCKLAGFEGHLTKPVNFQKLEAAIWQLTGSSPRQTAATR